MWIFSSCDNESTKVSRAWVILHCCLFVLVVERQRIIPTHPVGYHRILAIIMETLVQSCNSFLSFKVLYYSTLYAKAIPINCFIIVPHGSNSDKNRFSGCCDLRFCYSFRRYYINNKKEQLFDIREEVSQDPIEGWLANIFQCMYTNTSRNLIHCSETLEVITD